MIIEPPLLRDSTTINTSLRAASTRLRIGNRCGCGAVPGGASLINNPRRPTSPQMRLCSGGYTTSRPDATTAAGPQPTSRGIAIAPTCASTSMPRASPETTQMSFIASSSPSCRAKNFPRWVADRVPIIPTRRRDKTRASPIMNKTAGASGSPSNIDGYAAS